jgi:flagellar biogenesis protein FliO
MEWMFLKMILSLGAVLALMFGLVFVLKRFVLPGGTSQGLPVPIQVLGRKSLQPKKSVVILRVAEKTLVVGLSEQGMQLLTELTDADLRTADAPAMPSPLSGQVGGFAAQLQKTLNTIVSRKAEQKHA